MRLDSIRELKSTRRKKFSSDEVVDIHRRVEAYVDRVLLIGLRRNGAQYRVAKEAIQKTYQPLKERIKQAFKLLDKEQVPHTDFLKIKTLMLKFSGAYRNKLAHGVIQEIDDSELVSYICLIDVWFVREFESVLKKEFGHSAFDEPSKWGAGNGVIKDLDTVVGILNLGEPKEQPLALNKVKASLVGTKYQNVLDA
jgi:hypothetical protein